MATAPLAHITNSGSDIDSSTEATYRGYENTAFSADATALSANEQTAIVALGNALRGRGVRRPIDLLFSVYHDPIRHASYDESWAISVAGASRR